MKFERTSVMNFEGALRGMRNPMNSWAKSDSTFDDGGFCPIEYAERPCAQCPAFHGEEFPCLIIGPNDMDLARRLITAGNEHRKFLRQIFVSVDITAPLYFWKEFDTYKVGTTANSTSTMHKLASTPITLDCFETDDYNDMVDVFNNPSPMEYPLHDFISCADGLLDMLESLRIKYNETKDKRYWKELIRWLPNGWLQTRTVTMNYENLRSMYHQRKHHKLCEWSVAFCEWIKGLPYAKEFIIE